MGWYGEVESGLKDAAKEIDQYPQLTLGWFLAAKMWNHWAWEAVDDDNDWDDTGLPADKLPKNCEFEYEGNLPLIKIPKFNMNQALQTVGG